MMLADTLAGWTQSDDGFAKLKIYFDERGKHLYDTVLDDAGNDYLFEQLRIAMTKRMGMVYGEVDTFENSEAYNDPAFRQKVMKGYNDSVESYNSLFAIVANLQTYRYGLGLDGAKVPPKLHPGEVTFKRGGKGELVMTIDLHFSAIRIHNKGSDGKPGGMFNPPAGYPVTITIESIGGNDLKDAEKTKAGFTNEELEAYNKAYSQTVEAIMTMGEAAVTVVAPEAGLAFAIVHADMNALARQASAHFGASHPYATGFSKVIAAGADKIDISHYKQNVTDESRKADEFRLSLMGSGGFAYHDGNLGDKVVTRPYSLPAHETAKVWDEKGIQSFLDAYPDEVDIEKYKE
uniref:Uncharacterized protein n=1 Tax=Parascaris equorum TaxID=6256 RepID=A0A914R1K4_PAREQ